MSSRIKQFPQISSNKCSSLKYLFPALAITAGSLFLVLKKDKNEPEYFQVSPGTTITAIVKDSLGLTQEQKDDPKLCKILLEEVARQNKENIPNPDQLKIGDIISIDQSALTPLIKEYEKNQKEDWKEAKRSLDQKKKNKKENKEIITEEVEYLTLTSITDFEKKSQQDYLVRRLWNDSATRNRKGVFMKEKIIKELNTGYKILVPKEIETKSSPALSIEDITKPEKILSDKLNGYTIVLDPGHGSMDTGTITIVGYWDPKNKTKVVIYEAPIVMDISYRMAQGLRAHGAKVVLTHYMNRRGISERKDLPPASRIFDKNGEESFQDIWYGEDFDKEGSIFRASNIDRGKRNQVVQNQKSGVGKIDLFISNHIDSYPIVDKKLLHIKHKEGDARSQKFAQSLLNNGFEYTYQGKRAGDVDHAVWHQPLQVLTQSNADVKLLLELGNANQVNQAYYFRDPQNRQKIADNFINSFLKSITPKSQ